jgi:hypothetical protein
MYMQGRVFHPLGYLKSGGGGGHAGAAKDCRHSCNAEGQKSLSLGTSYRPSRGKEEKKFVHDGLQLLITHYI